MGLLEGRVMLLSYLNGEITLQVYCIIVDYYKEFFYTSSMFSVSSLQSSVCIVRFSMRMRKNRTILEARGISQPKMEEDSLRELLQTARNRAAMECGMYRLYLPQIM